MITPIFTQHFEIIYNKFLLMAPELGITQPSKLKFAKFLGVNHGKMQAWEKGQWPSALDLANIERKMKFNLRWLVTGEGEPEQGPEAVREEPKGGQGDSGKELAALHEELAAMRQQLSEVQSSNIQLVRELKEALHDLKQAQTESIGWQKGYLSLYRQTTGQDPAPSVTGSPALGAPTYQPDSDEKL